jgi:hypothetical protein
MTHKHIQIFHLDVRIVIGNCDDEQGIMSPRDFLRGFRAAREKGIRPIVLVRSPFRMRAAWFGI